MTWQPIHTASHGPDAPEVLVAVCIASVWTVRNARWVNVSEWLPESDEGDEDDTDGWWAYKNSITQEQLTGIYEPKWWMPLPEMPQ